MSDKPPLNRCLDCGEEFEHLNKCPKCGSQRVLLQKAAVSVSVGVAVKSVLTVIHHWEHLLQSADRLLDDQHWGAAVIVAQTACEVIFQCALAARLAAIGQAGLALPIGKLARPCSPDNKTVRRLYNVLAGDDIAGRGFWSASSPR